MAIADDVRIRQDWGPTGYQCEHVIEEPQTFALERHFRDANEYVLHTEPKPPKLIDMDYAAIELRAIDWLDGKTIHFDAHHAREYHGAVTGRWRGNTPKHEEVPREKLLSEMERYVKD